MKFTINTKDLLKSLEMVGGLIKPNGTMPILRNILFSLDNGTLTLEADNLEIRSTIKTPVEFSDTFSVCIPYQTLVSVLKGFPNTPVDMVFTENNVSIQQIVGGKVNGQYKIPTEKAEEFPKNTFQVSGDKVVFNSLDFAEYLRKAASFLDVKENGPIGNVLVWITENGTKIVGGNSGLIYEHSLPVNGASAKLMLSGTVASYLYKSIVIEESMEVSYTNNKIFFTLEGRQISAILSNAQYPDYATLFDRLVIDRNLKVDRDSLVPALKRISTVTDSNCFGVGFSFKGENLNISFSHVAGKGDAKESVTVDYEGEPLEIGFNINQLLNAFNILDGDITLGMYAANRGCLITADNTRCLTMPMKPDHFAVVEA